MSKAYLTDEKHVRARARDCTPLPRDPPCGDLRPPVSKPRYDIDCSNSKVFIIHKYWCIVSDRRSRSSGGAINIPDWTDLFRSEQRLESTDWNMSPWCVWISILGPCIYTPFFLPLSSDWLSPIIHIRESLTFIHIMRERSFYRKGGKKKKRNGALRGCLLVSLSLSHFLSLFSAIYFAQIKLFRTKVRKGATGMSHTSRAIHSMLLSFVNFLLSIS